MCRILQINYIREQQKKMFTAIVFLLCFIVISILSKPFILTHVHHEHDYSGTNGNCAACILIKTYEDLISQLSMIYGGKFSAFACLFTAAAVLKPAVLQITMPTPVALKTRMNN